MGVRVAREALDEAGALLAPLATAAILALRQGYRVAFLEVAAIPFIIVSARSKPATEAASA